MAGKKTIQPRDAYHARALEKSRAGYALRRARVPPPTECAACGLPQGEKKNGALLVAMHHHDYSKPLDVVGLCPKCHSRVHAGTIPDPATGERCRYITVGKNRTNSPLHNDPAAGER